MPSKYSAMGSTKTSRNGSGNGSSRAPGRNAVFWGCENVVIAPTLSPLPTYEHVTFRNAFIIYF
jgi:hypothetical protein